MSRQLCPDCGGRGVAKDADVVCSCCYIAAWRQYLARYEKARAQQLSGSTAAQMCSNNYQRTEEDFIADMELTARRILDPADYRLFRLSVIKGYEWAAVARHENLLPDAARQAARRIQEQFGCAFHELHLYPKREHLYRVAASTSPVRPPLRGPA